ncbi:hypothetical protein LUZ60_014646 [Juncus effusus]|nr:hypothetical protein LUZ60_014646 [Juncus effusus]
MTTTALCRLLHAFLMLVAVVEVATAATLLEKQVLLSFKANVSSDPNNVLSSWTVSGDPCNDFAGVYCDPFGSVQRIIIHGAGLAGVLSPALSMLPALQSLSLFRNSFTGGVPDSYSSLSLTLHKLNLSRNSLSGGVPAFLGQFVGLRLLDLSYNSFSGQIPEELFQNCLKTRYVSLSHNLLTGPVPDSIGNCTNLAGFDFSFNNLTGGFLPQICEPPLINYVSLRSNSLSGSVSDKISNCKSLDLFDIGSNKFTGSAPFNLINLVNISYFNISWNQFTGQIPEISSCSERLSYFDVSGNFLIGEIVSGISNCTELRFLDFGFNNLSGSIPDSIGGLKSLSVLRLSGNKGISGQIPDSIGQIDLLQVLDFENLHLFGQIPNSLSQCRFLLELDLAGNNLQGEIPNTLFNLTYLKILDLHSNQLNNSIPADLGNLTNLESLDFSNNNLTGQIPNSLIKLIKLTRFNLSNNNLSGEIPFSQLFINFGPASFINNPLLCGPPLNNNCGNFHKKAHKLSISVIIVIIAACIILIGVCIVSVMNIKAYQKRNGNIIDTIKSSTIKSSTIKSSEKDEIEEQEGEIILSGSTPPIILPSGTGVIIGKLVLFSKNLPNRYEDWETGTKALLDRDCIIGTGSIGTVYKASFETGVSIAVKKLERLGQIRNQEEFEHEMSRLGGLNHSNLVQFQGYYWSTNMQLILSEFVNNGSLFDHIHGNLSKKGELNWERRFRVALGVAKAVSYLHHDCEPQILHLNIKLTNILLDDLYEAKLADFGLGKLLPILGSFELAKFHSAVGYVAPELADQSLKYSDKCDVYSFGVVLLEIVTGRKPVESGERKKVVVLRDFVREVLEEGFATDCFDRRLRGVLEAELIQVLKLGLICTAESPAKRPSMAEVVQFLESVRNGS